MLVVLLMWSVLRLKRWLDGNDDVSHGSARQPVYHEPGPSMQNAVAAALRQEREDRERRASYRGPYRW